MGRDFTVAKEGKVEGARMTTHVKNEAPKLPAVTSHRTISHHKSIAAYSNKFLATGIENGLGGNCGGGIIMDF